MNILDKINEMKKEGLDDSQISRRLREEGISPKEIDDALEQGQVKSAVYEEAAPPYPDFQPEIASHAETEDFEQPAIAMDYPQNPSGQEYGEYPDYQYQNAPPVDTEMISEIVEQILDEKTKEMQTDISELIKFKIEMQGAIDNIDYRLKRIEHTIDKLQTSILGTIGNYGKNISDLKREVQMTQESFSKVISPLAENLEELRKITKETKTIKKK